MKTVYKFKVPLEDYFTLQLPKEASFLSFAEQTDGLFLWALVDTGKAITSYNFRLAGTGHPLPQMANLRHIGTCHAALSLVWHLFLLEGATI